MINDEITFRPETPLIRPDRGEDEQDALSTNEDEGEHLEEVIDRIGYGRFHYYLLVLLSWAVSSDAVEIVCVSFILPSLDCDLNVSTLLKGWLNSIIFIGMMIGGYTWGSLSDIWGRRRSLIVCLLVNGVAAVGSSFAQSIWLFIVLRLISGIGVGGSYPIVFSYFVEFQPRSHRGTSITILSSIWMLAGMATAGLAWAIVPQREWGFFSPDFVFNSWRIFIVICAIPALTSAFMVVYLPESPKFLLKAGRQLAALEVINRVALTNKKIKPGESICRAVYLDNTSSVRYHNVPVVQRMWRILKEMFSKRWRRVSIVSIFVRFVLAFGYYGLLLWLPELFKRMEQNGGSPCHLLPSNGTHNATDPCSYEVLSDPKPYFNSFLVNLANLPGNILTYLIIDRVGRRLLLASGMVITAISVFFIALVKTETDTLILTCIFGGISTLSWNSLNVIGSEILPTHLRATSIGLGQIFNRIGAILGNLAFGILVDVNCIVPLLLAASLMASGGLCSLLWPETKGVNIN